MPPAACRPHGRRRAHDRLQVEADVALAVGFVDVLRSDERQHERRRFTGIHGHVGTRTQLAPVQRVLDAELERHIAGDDADSPRRRFPGA